MMSNSRVIPACQTCYGFKRSELSRNEDTITPIGMGAIKTLREKFDLVMGHLSPPVDRLHPLFQYLILQTIKFDLLNGIKPSEYQCQILEEMTANTDSSQNRTIKDSLRQIYRQILEKRKRASQHQKRGNKLIAFQTEMVQIWQQKQQEFFALYSAPPFHQNQTILSKLSEAIYNISPLKHRQQRLAYQLFQKIHKNFFSICPSQSESYSFSIKKGSYSPQCCLQTLKEHIFLEKEGTQMGDIHRLLIRDIGTELKRYHQSVSDSSNQRFYYWIDDSHIMLDQFMLMPRLQYKPALLESLGLKNKPLTIENLISFYPTPKGFNYFRSPKEVFPLYSSRTQTILNDPFYGCIDMYGKDFLRMEEIALEEIKEEKRQLQELKQHLCCWKFMELGYYINNNGKMFGSNNSLRRPQEVQAYFTHELKKAEQNIGSGQGLYPFFGSFIRKPPFSEPLEQNSLSFSSISSYLGISDSQDGLIQTYSWERLISYRKLRLLLLSSILQILSSDRVLVKMYNIKKYACMSLLLGCEILEELKIIVDSQFDSEGLKRVFRRGDIQIGSLKNKSNYEFFLSVVAKIQKYGQRNPERDLQARFMLMDSKGIEIISFLNEVKRVIDLMMSFKLKLNLINQVKRYQSDKDNEEATVQLAGLIQQHYDPLKKKCLAIAKELLVIDPFDRYDKISKTDLRAIQCYRLFQKRLSVLFTSYCYAKLDYLSDYLSIIVPLLNISESKPKAEQMLALSCDVNVAMENLNIIDAILNDYK